MICKSREVYFREAGSRPARFAGLGAGAEASGSGGAGLIGGDCAASGGGGGGAGWLAEPLNPESQNRNHWAPLSWRVRTQPGPGQSPVLTTSAGTPPCLLGWPSSQ
jgi:hypothetical protein